VAFWRDVVPDFADLPVLADPERHAHDPEKRLSQERFHAAGAVGLDDIEVRIGKQRKIQFVLDLELRLGFNGIAAASDNRRM